MKDEEQSDKPKQKAGLFWNSFGVVALLVCIVCIIFGKGDSAIAAAIIFATTIYAFRHDL